MLRVSAEDPVHVLQTKRHLLHGSLELRCEPWAVDPGRLANKHCGGHSVGAGGGWRGWMDAAVSHQGSAPFLEAPLTTASRTKGAAAATANGACGAVTHTEEGTG